MAMIHKKNEKQRFLAQYERREGITLDPAKNKNKGKKATCPVNSP